MKKVNLPSECKGETFVAKPDGIANAATTRGITPSENSSGLKAFKKMVKNGEVKVNKNGKVKRTAKGNKKYGY